MINTEIESLTYNPLAYAIFFSDLTSSKEIECWLMVKLGLRCLQLRRKGWGELPLEIFEFSTI